MSPPETLPALSCLHGERPSVDCPMVLLFSFRNAIVSWYKACLLYQASEGRVSHDSTWHAPTPAPSPTFCI